MRAVKINQLKGITAGFRKAFSSIVNVKRAGRKSIIFSLWQVREISCDWCVDATTTNSNF